MTTAITTTPAARTDALRKVYGQGEASVVALDDVSVEFEHGRFTAVMGASGSGKSTLMHCVAGLDSPTEGSVFIGETEIGGLKDKGLTELRRDRIGFVFQSFNLIPTLTANENILLPLAIAGRKPDKEWYDLIVDTVGLRDRLSHKPSELSGGQQQRVACARALMSQPAIIFADEPTGNLDSRSGAEVLGFLRRSVDEFGQTIVMVTHDSVAAAYTDRVIFLADGRIVDEILQPTRDAVLRAMGSLEPARALPSESPAKSLPPEHLARAFAPEPSVRVPEWPDVQVIARPEPVARVPEWPDVQAAARPEPVSEYVPEWPDVQVIARPEPVPARISEWPEVQADPPEPVRSEPPAPAPAFDWSDVQIVAAPPDPPAPTRTFDWSDIPILSYPEPIRTVPRATPPLAKSQTVPASVPAPQPHRPVAPPEPYRPVAPPESHRPVAPPEPYRPVAPPTEPSDPYAGLTLDLSAAAAGHLTFNRYASLTPDDVLRLLDPPVDEESQRIELRRSVEAPRHALLNPEDEVDAPVARRALEY